jgi:hypothetical protein
MKIKRGSSASAPHSESDRADNFAAAFLALKRPFLQHEKHLHITADTRGRYYLETRSPSYKGRPLFFGAVISGRVYVSFHLMPLYWDAALRNRVSGKLKKHMEGKSCFNFTVAPEPALLRELIQLTTAGFALYRRKNLL